MGKKLRDKVTDVNFSFPFINLEYGSPTYSDIDFNQFLLNKNEGTMFDFKVNGNSAISCEEIEAELAPLLGAPTYCFVNDITENANSMAKLIHYSDHATFFCKVSKDKTIDSSARYTVNIYCTDKEFGKKIIEVFSKNFKSVETDNIYVISTSQDSLSLNNLGRLKYSFIRDNYEDKVLKGYDYVVSEYNKASPSGRITIVNGPPGGGKTNLLKGMISEIKNSTTILLPSKFVVDLDSPSIVSLLIEERSDRFGALHMDDEESSSAKKKNKTSVLFIVEDADDCLVPRDGANMSTISSLLNYTDGIFGSMLDLRIIATTNADHVDFDKALTRPGRLCKHIIVEALSPEKATSVHDRLTDGKDKEFTYGKKTTLAQVYADIKGGFEDAETDKKVLGFQG